MTCRWDGGQRWRQAFVAVALFRAAGAARLIAALTTATAAGTLYEVDMRLRPTGNKGPVAVSLESFAAYHASESWTWEHMALTRGRLVAGSESLRGRVEAEIRRRLTEARDPAAIIADARDMRARMAESFPGAQPLGPETRAGRAGGHRVHCPVFPTGACAAKAFRAGHQHHRSADHAEGRGLPARIRCRCADRLRAAATCADPGAAHRAGRDAGDRGCHAGVEGAAHPCRRSGQLRRDAEETGRASDTRRGRFSTG